ncbi:hypothetical protein FOXYS1_6484 [Fusarium oxysporum]|uniref:Uncharacterized protein n=1 Tax=Fusarium oxysporum TaxID=5507 RepID=A0A8H5EJD0_FUSOX|nr:hypothetical protein FOXYS1_6484 [Fusarium oxysporum]
MAELDRLLDQCDTAVDKGEGHDEDEGEYEDEGEDEIQDDDDDSDEKECGDDERYDEIEDQSQNRVIADTGDLFDAESTFAWSLDSKEDHSQDLATDMLLRFCSLLSQLRTGMARINSYLSKIRAAESDMCECGRAPETMEHFLFWCARWETERQMMRQIGQSMMGRLSFFLGEKAASDGPKWAPNLEAVRAAVRFAMATGRLN